MNKGLVELAIEADAFDVLVALYNHDKRGGCGCGWEGVSVCPLQEVWLARAPTLTLT